MVGLERFAELICDIAFVFRINDGNVALICVCIRIQLKYDIRCKVAAFYHIFYDIERVLLLCFFFVCNLPFLGCGLRRTCSI